MAWEIELDDDFAVWLQGLDEGEQREILGVTELLRERGPYLKRPHVDTVKWSAYKNMKELRVQIAGKPWRILFAFDPKRSAFLLIGGNKGGDPRWYETNIPIADQRFKRHLAKLKKE